MASTRNHLLLTMSIAVTGIGIASGLVANIVLLPAEARAGGRAYILLKNTAYWSLWAVMIPAAVGLALRIRRRGWPWPAAVAAHCAAAFAFAGFHLAALAVIDFLLRYSLLNRNVRWQFVANDLAAAARLTVEWELTMYAALAAFAYATALHDEVRQHAKTEAELSASLTEARLQALQRQLQPHFLFNTLHAVSALIRRDPDAAEAMIERLGRLLRTTLRSGSAAEVTVAQDLVALKDYLAIEEVQMRERLKVTFALGEDVLGAAVPALLLQPIVENSVRHGLQPRGRGGAIHVSVRRASDDLCLEVVDDGVGLSGGGPAPGGVGLANTRSRLAQLYGTRQSFSLSGIDTGGVHVRITLPFRTL